MHRTTIRWMTWAMAIITWAAAGQSGHAQFEIHRTANLTLKLSQNGAVTAAQFGGQIGPGLAAGDRTGWMPGPRRCGCHAASPAASSSADIGSGKPARMPAR